MEKFLIDEETRNKTTLCAEKQLCLSGPKAVACPVQYMIEEVVLFVDKKNKKGCNYYLPYGLSGICMCPVRKELFKKYKI